MCVGEVKVTFASCIKKKKKKKSINIDMTTLIYRFYKWDLKSCTYTLHCFKTQNSWVEHRLPSNRHGQYDHPQGDCQTPVHDKLLTGFTVASDVVVQRFSWSGPHGDISCVILIYSNQFWVGGKGKPWLELLTFSHYTCCTFPFRR